MSDRKRIFYLVIVVTAPLVVYARSLGFPFVTFDDPNYIVDNPLLGPGVGWFELLFTPQLGYPMPVTVGVYRLLRLIGGTDPWVYHGFNWVMHGVNSLLLFLLVERLLDTRRALLATLLWALHPLAAEPVSWCTGTKDLLYGAFALSAAYCHVRNIDRGGEGRGILAVLIFGLLAILSKPVAFLLPVVLLVYPLVTGRAGTLRLSSHRMTYVAMVLVAAMVVLSGTLISAHAGGEIRYKTITDTSLASLEHLGLILSNVGLHARHLLVPLDLVPAYLPPAAGTWAWAAPLLGGLAICLTGFGLWWTWTRRQPRRFWLLAAFTVSYAPVSQAIPTIHFAPDSYLYVPGMFLAALAVSAIPPLPRSLGWRAWALKGLAVAGFHLLGLLAMQQSMIWSSSSTLWAANVDREPADAAVAMNLAKAWDLEDRRDLAAQVIHERLDDIIAQDRIEPFMLTVYEESSDEGQVRALYARLLSGQEQPSPLLARRWVEFLRRGDLRLRPEELSFTSAGLGALAAAASGEGGDPARLRQIAAAAHWLGLREDTARILEAHFNSTGDASSGGMALRIYRDVGLEQDAARVNAVLRGLSGGGVPGSGPSGP